MSTLTSEPEAAPTAPHRSHRWVYILIAAVVAAATAVALILTLGGNGYPDTPSGILQRDGYTVTKTMDHEQLANEASTDEDSMSLAWIDSVAYGTKPGSMEAVAKLTTAGKGIMGLLVPAIQATGAEVKMEGDYLIISGSPDQFSGVEFDLGGGSTSPSEPSPSGTPATLADPVAILGQTGATPDPGTKVGKIDMDGNRYASGSFSDGVQLTVYACTSSDNAAEITDQNTPDDDTGVILLPQENVVVVMSAGYDGWGSHSPEEISLLVHGPNGDQGLYLQPQPATGA